ncbi:MAG: amidohydrolase family protein [Planctomycetes bacterium]|nr:amidohydrolase family protein [Planctomycetota bacterium]
MIDLPIVDTHVHFWDPDGVSTPWLPEYPEICKRSTPVEYSEAIGDIPVESIVFIEAEVGREKALDEAKWVAEIAEEDKRIKCIIPWAPVEDGDAVRDAIEELLLIPRVNGIRRLIQFQKDPDLCVRSKFIRGVQILAEYNLSFDICIAHDQLPKAIQMVRKCPQVSFILDHIAKPNIKDGLLEPWKTDLKELSMFDNVTCKVSGFVSEAEPFGWKKEEFRPYFEHVVECFTFDRLMFGGDWPMLNLHAQYRQWFAALEWLLSGCSKDELTKLFVTNAQRVYKV